MWYVRVNGGFLVTSTRETSLGSQDQSGRCLNAPSDDAEDGQDEVLAGIDDRAYARRLDCHDDVQRPAALRALRIRAARSRDGKERGGDRHSEG